MTDIATHFANLSALSTGVLVIVYLLIVLQEAVNGCHDAANAVDSSVSPLYMAPTMARNPWDRC